MARDYYGALHRYHKCTECDDPADYQCHRCQKWLCRRHAKFCMGDASCKDCWDKL